MPDPATEILPRFDQSVFVIGDVILDEYLIGRATRLSREAAVPVLERTRRHLVAGGAANPAVGVVALGGSATIAGVVGEDAAASSLRTLLDGARVSTRGMVVDPGRPTTTKTRIIAEGGFVYGQHLARVDHLDRRPLDAEVEREIVEIVRDRGPHHDVLLVSDYKAGVITPRVVESLLALRAVRKIPLVVDSQGDLERFAGFDLVKCNRAEAESFLGEAIPTGDPAARRDALSDLRKRTAARAVVVTLGGEGIAWHDGREYGETKAPRAQVFDVTGAGDTVIAVLALAQAASLPLSRGCFIAVHAAALTVRVMGNHTPTRAEVTRTLAEAGESWIAP